jgi:hypothetical protein
VRARNGSFGRHTPGSQEPRQTPAFPYRPVAHRRAHRYQSCVSPATLHTAVFGVPRTVRVRVGITQITPPVASHRISATPLYAPNPAVRSTITHSNLITAKLVRTAVQGLGHTFPLGPQVTQNKQP